MADDEPVSRTVVGAMLKKAGYPVTFAHRRRTGLEQLDSDDPPAIALLDWEMPGLQGPEVVSAHPRPAGAGADLRHPADLARLIRRHRRGPARPAPTIT